MDDAANQYNYFQTAILAVIQGAAELLPVSSSAHVIFAQKLMGKDPSSPQATFLLVMLHTGTMGAVLVYFWPRWRRLLLPETASSTGTAMSLNRFLAMLVLATAATGILGLALQQLIERVIMERMLHWPKGEVELLFKELPLIGAALLAAGLLILFAGLFEDRAAKTEFSPRVAIVIGLVQGLCLPFRGFSRSGATISTALLSGISRPFAEDFSFALAVVLTPVAIARMLWRLVKSDDWKTADMHSLLGPGVIGMFLSFAAGLIALWFLSAVLERGRWRYFGVYCLVASVVLFGYAFFNHAA
jgi:undecaprenyl-diphosphatase